MAGWPKRRATRKALDELGPREAFFDLYEGKSLTQLCHDKNWSIGEALRWIGEDEERTACYFDACRWGSEALAHETRDIAKGSAIQVTDKDGNPVYNEDGSPKVEQASTNRDRLKITTNLELASAWSPRYRKKVQGESGDVAGAVDPALLGAMGELLRLTAQRREKVVAEIPAGEALLVESK